MVHSALKRKRSLAEFSEEVLHEEAPTAESIQPTQETPPTDTPQTKLSDEIWKPSPDWPEDPRPTVLALLSFLSDTELFTLVVHRIAHAVPYSPPLYLTSFCICGMQEFFTPQRPASEALPTNADSPFVQVPKLRNEKGYIPGRPMASATKGRATAVLVSLATLFHFLTPQELRLLIQARVATSEAPHYGVKWFLEFMHSGGDGVPRGKRDMDQRQEHNMTRKPRKPRAEKRLAQQTIKKNHTEPVGIETTSSSSHDFLPVMDGPSMCQGTTASFAAAEDNEPEEGEIPPDSGPPEPTTQPVASSSSRKKAGKKKKKLSGPKRDSQERIIQTADPEPPPKKPS